MSISAKPDLAFTKALPKVELHAHLTGSISKQCLHDIWLAKISADAGLALEDPLIAIPSVKDGGIDVVSFFPIFDRYIYALVCDEESIRHATASVLQDFADDGVCYVELRTTPRVIATAGINKEGYVSIVLDAMDDFAASQQNRLDADATGKEKKLHVKLILSIDRKNTLQEAMEVVALAAKYRDQGIVGIDLCGNPTRKPISHLSPAFAEAKRLGLGITVHFAEMPQDGSEELEMMLEWQPQSWAWSCV
ncbi:Metallo-dependent hydrolase, partial [Aureobasidium sp. EXF-3399]